MMITAFLASVLAMAMSNLVVPTDYTTIQEAIDNSADGGTVVILPGTYHENLVTNQNITLRGLFYYDPKSIATTVIISDNDDRVLDHSGENVLNLIGLTFVGKNGGVRVHYSEVNIENCQFIRNGGIALSIKSDTVTITDSFFLGNTIGVQLRKTGLPELWVIDRCIFRGNESEWYGAGLNLNGSATINNSIFHENYASSGAAIYLEQSSGVLDIYHSLFWQNVVDVSGQDVFARSGNTVNIYNSIFWGGHTFFPGRLPMPIRMERNPCFPDLVSKLKIRSSIVNEICFYQDRSHVSLKEVYEVDPQINDDYTVLHTSPAIDSGVNEHLWNNFDYFLNPRIIGGRTDIGPYEWYTSISIFDEFNKVITRLLGNSR